MKHLSKEEFTDRLMAIQRATRIFIESGLTNNISVAFDTYQDVLAGRERTRKISITPPNCECGKPMMFVHVPKNDGGIVLQLVCTSPKCDIVLNSEHDMIWWSDQLSKEQRA